MIKELLILLTKLSQSFNRLGKSEEEVLLLDRSINFIAGTFGSMCRRVISLKRRLDRLRLTALPIFLLATIVDENNSEGRNKATKLLLTNFVP